MNHSNNSKSLSRKEREKYTRQQEILNAARELFIRKGYHNTTLEEIAHYAEFGKGTIYNYFSSKEELFYGIIERLANETFTLVQSAIATSGSAREKLTAYAKAILSQTSANADLFRFIFQEFHRSNSVEHKEKIKLFDTRLQETLKLIAQALNEDKELGKIQAFDSLKMAILFDGMVRTFCINLFRNQSQLSDDKVDTVVAFIVTIFFDGVTERNFKG